MPQLLYIPALQKLPIKLSTEEKCKNIYVLHMIGERQNAYD